MTYKGHVENGAIVLDEPVDLPEGAVLKIDIQITEKSSDEPSSPTLYEQLSGFIGVLDDMPEDWSEHHDYYLREEHKR